MMLLPKLTRLPILAVLFLLACKSDKQEAKLFELMTTTGISFANTISNTEDFNIFSYRNFYNGAGVGIGDLNNDGLPEIFFCSNMGENKLYYNKGDWKFEDISNNAGLLQRGKWATGVTMVDINGDGLLDIYVSYAGYQKGIDLTNELYINKGNLQFSEEAAAYGLNEGGYTTHAAFFDYDLDGDLDAYILNNSFIPVNTLNYANKRELRASQWPVADFLKGGGDKLLRNEDGKFVDVSEEAGIYGSLIGFGLGVTVGDINNDGYPDMYISNDFFERDYLYINQQDGTFKEDIEARMQHISLTSMGADIGDINNDGHQDIFTTDMLPANDARLKTTTTFESIDVRRLMVRQGFYHQYMQNTLQVSNKNGKFYETGYYSGVAASDWSWGGLIFDMDNDGLSDIFVCNGIYHDITDQDFIDFFADEVIQKMALTGRKEQMEDILSRMPNTPIANAVFQNQGALKFKTVSAEWGLDQASFSNGSAYGDLDNDGDLDLVVNNVNGLSFVYRNNTAERGLNQYIGFRLKGTGANRFAVGSKIIVYQGENILSRQVNPARGFQSSVDYHTIIGLGSETIDSVRIIWPDRRITRLSSLQSDSTYTIEQVNTEAPSLIAPSTTTDALMQPFRQSFKKHQEDDYVDFYDERNIFLMLSREGPKAAIADVNGDGNEDILIGAAAGSPATLYLQEAGGFRQSVQNVFEEIAIAEDDALHFMDFDGDGDVDLFIGSGGNKSRPGDLALKNRLLINDGKGNFRLLSAAIPGDQANTSVLISEDFNEDGRPDLFIGSRNTPFDYGTSPASYLLMNNGPNGFTDIAKGSPLENCGMVRAAQWADLDGDGNKELIVVGDYMYPMVFAINENKVQLKSSGLENYTGFWQSLAIADIDNDGDPDLVLGNFGENFLLRPDSSSPVKLWINDYDGNGKADKVLSRTINGKDFPVFMKREFTDQLPSFKKQNLKYRDYAHKTIQDLFSKELIAGSEIKTVHYISSSVAINDGKGNFSIRPLPAQLQLSSIHAILISDLNGDGYVDIISGGNNFNFLPQFGRLDASFGNISLNDGRGEFRVLSDAETGLNIRGMIRDIQEIKINNRPAFLFLQNNDLPLIFQLNK